MSIFDKFTKAIEASLDNIIEKSQDNKKLEPQKGFIEIDHANAQQQGYVERKSLVGPGMMKTMARKNSIVASIHQTRKSQVSNFARPQKDKYSTGWTIVPLESTDLTVEQKVELAAPDLQGLDNDKYEELRHKFETERAELKQQQDEDIKAMTEFILTCGWDNSTKDSVKRMDFEKFLKLIIGDRLTYNYAAIETIPTKGDSDKISHFGPLSSGTIRLVSRYSADKFKAQILESMIAKVENKEHAEALKARYESIQKPFRYVQVVRGRIVAAWTEDELVFEAANPTVDPEDQGYGFGELEMLITTITSHLYAEAHNRNFFTQGIASKGILHIKGENISRAQLEGFKREWFNKAINSRNAFRPPIIGMADEVKWVNLAQSNREMEYQSWLNYLIKVICAIYQIDPSEINFDISKQNVSTLNEGNNRDKLENSKDKGLKPLLMFVEGLLNNHILPRWNEELAKKYRFEFVGLDAETKQQESDRSQKEVSNFKTVNEVRAEHNLPAIEGGDVVLNGAYTQYIQMRMTAKQEAEGMGEGGAPVEEEEPSVIDELGDADLEGILQQIEGQGEEEEVVEEETKKSKATVVEYYIKDDDTMD